MNHEPFAEMLSGGHPNSLGRTVEVVDHILDNRNLLEELYSCYSSPDEVVRLRTSSAFKRIAKSEPAWLVPYIDRFLNEIALLDQASAQWTLAQLCDMLRPYMTPDQERSALTVMQRNLQDHRDWIVLNHTMQALYDWSEQDEALRNWLRPQLLRLTGDSRKSVAKRATRLLAKASAEK